MAHPGAFAGQHRLSGTFDLGPELVGEFELILEEVIEPRAHLPDFIRGQLLDGVLDGLDLGYRPEISRTGNENKCGFRKSPAVAGKTWIRACVARPNPKGSGQRTMRLTAPDDTGAQDIQAG